MVSDLYEKSFVEFCVLERILLSNLPGMYTVYSIHDLPHCIQIISLHVFGLICYLFLNYFICLYIMQTYIIN